MVAQVGARKFGNVQLKGPSNALPLTCPLAGFTQCALFSRMVCPQLQGDTPRCPTFLLLNLIANESPSPQIKADITAHRHQILFLGDQISSSKISPRIKDLTSDGDIESNPGPEHPTSQLDPGGHFMQTHRHENLISLTENQPPPSVLRVGPIAIPVQNIFNSGCVQPISYQETTTGRVNFPPPAPPGFFPARKGRAAPRTSSTSEAKVGGKGKGRGKEIASGHAMSDDDDGEQQPPDPPEGRTRTQDPVVCPFPLCPEASKGQSLETLKRPSCR